MISVPGSEEEEQIFQTLSSHCLKETQRFFASEDSPLKEASEHGGRVYEYRPQQAKMACAVAEAFEKSRHLCVEAPTGVGKSFAYLIPAIYQAVSMHRPVVVTTETINLQEQLIRKDLVLLRKLMKINFSFALAAGRANYLCKRRLTLASGEFQEELLPSEDMESELEKLVRWSEESASGFFTDLPFKVERTLWACVCSETASCSGAECRFFHNCFYWKARREWDKADVLVTNHALFFTDLKMRALEEMDNTLLPAYCAVIFDEAHTLEDNGAKHLGLHLTSGNIRYFLNRLYNPRTGRGLLMKPGESSLAIRALIAKLHDLSYAFFDQFSEKLEKLNDKCFRIRKSGQFEDFLSPAFSELERKIHSYLEEQENAEFKTELTSQLDRCMAIREGLGSFIAMKDMDNTVYWVEGRELPQNGGTFVELYSAPLNVAELLSGILFDSDFPVILTSATLAVNANLDFYMKRTGYHGGETLILDSPFHYEKQVRLYLARTMPFPSEQGYNDACCAAIGDFLELTDGHAFVLFTSYGMLRYCADQLKEFLSRKGYELFVHGETLSRSSMLEEFKASEKGVIFGTSSFWTGVDVPGDALKNVMITKLPFAVPNHPLTEGRCERIEAEHGRPFDDYSIPNAVLMFRQGIGRLIRSTTDEGIIVVLDPRIVTKYYGKNFLRSIPACPVEYF
ncbi:MAG: DEAD/DEAH box helicase family protein [Lentisphaeria bacterium]|nr:DEAD/DEAH box helicase family protein [Lentisphaeria bacterium]